MDKMRKRLYNISEAGEYLGVARSHFYELMEEYRLPRVKIGCREKYDIQDLDKLIQKMKAKK